MAQANGKMASEGISSLLDTDLYKLTMQCAVLKYFPDTVVSYAFTNRTPHMKLNKKACEWLQTQVDGLHHISVTEEELTWLEKTCSFLSKDYLAFLKTFRLRPDKQVTITWMPTGEGADGDQKGELGITVKGRWVDTILYEIPLLALICEAYFKFVDPDWTYDGQTENAKQKSLQLLEHGCIFSEFGTRRRRDYRTHELVMTGLLEAEKEKNSNGKGWKGKVTGTSNVHMAMRYGVTPIGTVAHEWFMGIAAITDDYANANETAMRYWLGTFGLGTLGIALTDTFGTPAFLKAFARPVPPEYNTSESDSGQDSSYAHVFAGVRQDSGDPLKFLEKTRRFYDDQGIHEKKVVVFSDSLNVDKCIRYHDATDAAGLTPSFGIGTFFTNDFKRTGTNEQSAPMNIVIKLSEAAGRPAVKLSDDVGKNMGDTELIKRIKAEVGYEERSFADEAHRWDTK